MELINVLDHGYVKFIESWGSDERIIEAARMSTGKGFKGWGSMRSCSSCNGINIVEAEGEGFTCVTCFQKWEGGTVPGDEKLLKFLYDHNHATPFEMAGMIIEVQAPIFVFREWHRHRTQSYNEMSARYTPLPDLNYVPTVERLLMNSQNGNKQAGTIKGAGILDEWSAARYIKLLKQNYQADQLLYECALEMGVPKELARNHLPVGRYSRMRVAANLRNCLAFLTLRSTIKNEAAQWEIRQFADAWGVFIEEKFPRAWDLFVGK